MLSDEQQHLGGELPGRGGLLGLRQRGDLRRGVAQGDERPFILHRDRNVEFPRPIWRHRLAPRPTNGLRCRPSVYSEMIYLTQHDHGQTNVPKAERPQKAIHARDCLCSAKAFHGEISIALPSRHPINFT